MPQLVDASRALLLLIVANVLPWLSARTLNRRWTTPLDLGLVMPDGGRLLGSHKTWRGVASAACGCTLAAWACGLQWHTGTAFAVLSLFGDALSSLVKRRLALAPGYDVVLLDQLPEALLPLVVLRGALALDARAIAAVTVVFALLDVAAAGVRLRTMTGCG